MLVKALENFTFYNDDPIQVYKGQVFEMDEDAAEFYISGGKAEEVEGGGDGGGNVVFIKTDVTENIDTGEYTGGFYKDNGDLYTYEELLTLHNSGATLLAYYEEWPISYIEVGDDGDDSYYFSAAVESTHDGGYYDVYLTEEGYELLDAGALSPRPFIVSFSLNGSPSSLTGDDIYTCDRSFERIMAVMNRGGDVIGAIATPFSQDVLEYVGGSYNEIQQVMTLNFRYVKMAYGATDYMEVLELGVNNSNGGTHIHSEFHRYALTAYTP